MAAMKPGGILAVPFLSKLKAMVKVGRSVFVHAGFLDADGKQSSISEINQAVKKFILEPTTNDNIFLKEKPACLENTLWMRDFSHPADKEPVNRDSVNETVKLALKAVDADRMVVGHMTQADAPANLWKSPN